MHKGLRSILIKQIIRKGKWFVNDIFLVCMEDRKSFWRHSKEEKFLFFHSVSIVTTQVFFESATNQRGVNQARQQTAEVFELDNTTT